MMKWIKYILFLVIGIALAWYASKDAEFDTIWKAAGQLNWGWVLLSMIVSYVAMIARGWRWNILLAPMGYTSRKSSNVHAVAFGYLMNDLIPRSGEVARCAVLSRAENIPVDKLVGTVILERIVDMITMLLVIAIATGLHADAIHHLWSEISNAKNAQPNDPSYTIWYLLGGMMIMGAIGIWIIIKYKHRPWIGKIYHFMMGILDGLRSILKLKDKFAFIIYTLIIWLSWILMSYFLLKALPETAQLTFADSIFFTVASGFGMIVPTQGGLGAYHLTSKWAFEALGLSGALGLTFAWISWIGKTIVEFVVGIIGFIIIDRRAKQQSK
jgi:glycosyltransferase 2 family protein